MCVTRSRCSPTGRRVHEYYCGLCLDAMSFAAIKLEVHAPRTRRRRCRAPTISFRDYALRSAPSVAPAAPRRGRGGRAAAVLPARTLLLVANASLGCSRMGRLRRSHEFWRRSRRAGRLSTSVALFGMLAHVGGEWSRHFTIAIMLARRLRRIQTCPASSATFTACTRCRSTCEMTIATSSRCCATSTRRWSRSTRTGGRRASRSWRS